MTVILIPKTPRSAYNPNRPLSSLLKTQMLHLREAEKLFPPEHHSDIYINAIKTEAEAAKYISRVTSTIRQLHEEAGPREARVPRIAAAAAPTRPKPGPKSKSKTKSKKRK